MSIDSLGGYRLVRKLGGGVRADVFLGFPQSGTGQPVAVKVFGEGVDDEAIVAEIEALTRAEGRHVVELLDLTTAPDGAPALILQRLPGGSVSRLLLGRSSLRPGEAVTILAPIATTVGRLHRAGVVHGRVRLESVLFDGLGAPVLACFGGSSLIVPNQARAGLEAQTGVADDIRSLGTLSRAVLSLAEGHAGAQQVLGWLDSGDDPDGWCEALADRLFALGEGEAVVFADSEHALAPLVPARLVAVQRAIDPAEPFDPPAAPTASRIALAIPDWLERALPDSAAAVVERLRHAAAAVRRPVWVAGALGVVALVTALLLSAPGGRSDAAARATASPSGAASDKADTGPIGGDDPSAALIALVALRERCIRERSVLCLDGVSQAGSSALAADQTLVRSIQTGAELPSPLRVSASQLVVVERLGGSAILGLGEVASGEPSSVLLIKGEGGWRIRDYLQR